MNIKEWIKTNLSFGETGSSQGLELDEVELQESLKASNESGSLGELEYRMILSVLELDDTLVKEILVPQPDVSSIPANMMISDIPAYVSNKPHTRYPVVNEDKEQVVGFIDLKDVISMYDKDQSSNILAEDIARDIPIFPETTRADELLISLQEDNKQMAAVIDEWGSLEGIVTIEDIVEVIVGDIRDEFDDAKEEPTINKTGAWYEVDGHVPIRRLNRVLRTDFEVDDGAETVAGLVLSEVGEVPAEGDALTINGTEFEILNVESNRISKIRIQTNQSGK